MNLILRPALHTLWQASLASLVMWWSASGLVGVRAVHSVSDAERFALTAVVGIGAALASALLHTARQYGPAILRAVLRKKLDTAELVKIYGALDAATAAPALPKHAGPLA